MGRQIYLYMLPPDCNQLLNFVQQRDPVVVSSWSSQSPEIREATSACSDGGAFCLWNQALLERLQRRHIPQSKHGPYYSIEDSLPVLELLTMRQSEWNGTPCLGKGRIYTGFNAHKGEEFERWYNAIARWVKTKFIKNPVAKLGGYVGPEAFEWHIRGGLFLPMIQPPITADWISFAKSQHPMR